MSIFSGGKNLRETKKKKKSSKFSNILYALIVVLEGGRSWSPPLPSLIGLLIQQVYHFERSSYIHFKFLLYSVTELSFWLSLVSVQLSFPIHTLGPISVVAETLHPEMEVDEPELMNPEVVLSTKDVR